VAEAAAEEIGARPLLARAAAYLHDVGKLSRPEYFVENQSDSSGNKHDQLSPQMSSLVITAHTRDGMEIAAEYGAPAPIREIIEQHHGATVVEYFHNRALEMAGEGEEVSKDSFRYRGPLPQTKEAGLVLLADAVESASRVLVNPTAPRVGALVRQIVRRRLLEGQLDESRLSLTDVRIAEEAFARTLAAILHRRVRYPEDHA
jgi:cyclic-di-AMP phosphodiesterase PgpH